MNNENCIPINFLKLKGQDTIKNFLHLKDLGNKFTWYKGIDNVSHGGLARLDNDECVAYILPIVYSMNYKKTANKNIDELANDLSWNYDNNTLVWKYNNDNNGYETHYQLDEPEIINNMNILDGVMLDKNVTNKIQELEAEALRLEQQNQKVNTEINNLKQSENEITQTILKGGYRKKSNLKNNTNNYKKKSNLSR